MPDKPLYFGSSSEVFAILIASISSADKGCVDLPLDIDFE